MYSLRPACAVAFNYERCQLTQKAPSFLSGLRISSRALLFHGTLSCMEEGKKSICFGGTTKKETHLRTEIHTELHVFFQQWMEICLTSACNQWLNQKYSITSIKIELCLQKCQWFVSAKIACCLPEHAGVFIASCYFACTYTQCFGSLHTSCLF